VLVHRHVAENWLMGLAVLVGLALFVFVFLALRRAKVVFDLEARQMRRGRRELPFEDILGVILSTAAARPSKASAAGLQELVLAVVLRSKESDLSERVARLARSLAGGAKPGEQLRALEARLRAEPDRLARTFDPVAAFLAADRLAVELGLVLIDLRAEPVAWTPKQLAEPLRLRLSRAGAPTADPGPPPDQVTEEAGETGPVLRFSRPRRQPLVTMLVNLVMLAVLLAVFFLVPAHKDGRDFNWGEIWPLVTAIFLVVPALLRSLFGRNRLELGAERLRFVTRFLGEQVREVEVAELRFVLVEQVGTTALVLVADDPALRLPMPLEAAKWVKARIEVFLVSGA